ncbi:MAG: hypothetical protein QOD70_1316 [Frankiales bacterium]|jgi:signal transduction histidine kinase|nr:hypothetical protein [Frankiales bacterium]
MSALAASQAASATTATTTLVHVTQGVELLVLACVLAVLGRRWAGQRTAATGWALWMFGILASVVVLGQFPVEDDGSLLRHGYTVVLVCVLLVVPYALVRFALALGAVGRLRHRVAAALTVGMVVATILSPRFPKANEDRGTWFTIYVSIIIVGWGVQSVLAAAGLWATGNQQSTVVRRRMRTLAAGAVVVTLALVAAGGSGSPSVSSQVFSALAGVVGIALLVLAFVAPAWLRSAWRAQDLLDLAAAERGLMVALDADQVAATILPSLRPLFAASDCYFLDVPGLSSGAPTGDGAAEVREELHADTSDSVVVVTSSGAFGCRLSTGWLVVEAGTLTPVFGPAELLLLERVGTFVDLALQRCRLYAEEAKSRRVAEAANAELQTLVYSVSHDLRNPIISVLGYLDVLQQEHAAELHGDVAHYLTRMTVNAQYMQSLIQDLLELSRIGRSEPQPQAVPVGDLAESVAAEVLTLHEGSSIRVEGDFPVVWMSEVRARQLLTNLIDNAAKHGSAGSTVVVRCAPGPEGQAELTVADDGPGIPSHYRDKAFEVFERLDAAHTDVPGTGMGLPICRRIVESLGGTITLDEPEAWTKTGTTVRVTLPTVVVTGWTTSPAPREREHVT